MSSENSYRAIRHDLLVKGASTSYILECLLDYLIALEGEKAYLAKENTEPSVDPKSVQVLELERLNREQVTRVLWLEKLNGTQVTRILDLEEGLKKVEVVHEAYIQRVHELETELAEMKERALRHQSMWDGDVQRLAKERDDAKEAARSAHEDAVSLAKARDRWHLEATTLRRRLDEVDAALRKP